MKSWNYYERVNLEAIEMPCSWWRRCKRTMEECHKGAARRAMSVRTGKAVI
jgi:hypothetical protein